MMERTIKQAMIWVCASVVSVTLIWFIQYHYRMYVFQQAMEDITAPLQQTQQRHLAQQEQARRERQEAERAERARVQAEHDRQRRQREFESAFLATYQEPEGCDRYTSQSHMVECVNHKMRAKQAFHEEFFGEPTGPAVIEAAR